MLVKDAMHKGVDWCSADTPVSKMARIMREKNVGAVPIGEDHRVIGMVTDRDVVCRLFINGRDPDETTAQEAMTAGVVYCKEDHDLSQAVALMEEKKVRRLPVLNASKRMVGMRTLGDVVQTAPRKLVSVVCHEVAAHH